MKTLSYRLFGKCTPENSPVKDDVTGKDTLSSTKSAVTADKVSMDQVADAMQILNASASRKKTKILVDNGHGKETPGKRSPDGLLLEWAYTRWLAGAVVDRLIRHGYDAEKLVPEMWDVKLSERVRRVNAWCQKLGATNVLVVSIHVNAAASDGKWHDADGWQACVSLNASMRSMKLAECLADAAIAKGLKLRKPAPTQKWWTQNLAICRDTHCPAVLTENLFMDNRRDAGWLNSEEGRQTIADLHVKGIEAYLGS